MSPSMRQGIGLGVALLLAAALQSAFSEAMQIRGARPDFLLTVALLGALFCDANGGTALGFFAGLFHASLASPPEGGFGALIFSRTLICGGVGWLDERLFRDNPLIALVVVPVGTALAEVVFFLIAPQTNVGFWARSLGLSALYNTLLSLPLYLALFRLMGDPRKREAF